MANVVLPGTRGTRGSMHPFSCLGSMERLPTEVAITENMRRFKHISRTAAVR
jgi:predicted TIM-barrel enzyme